MAAANDSKAYSKELICQLGKKEDIKIGFVPERDENGQKAVLCSEIRVQH